MTENFSQLVRPRRSRALRRARATISFSLAGALAICALAGCGGSAAKSGGAKGGSGPGGGGQSHSGPGHTATGSWGGVINPGGSPRQGGTLTVDQDAAPEGVSSLYYDVAGDNQIGQVVDQIYDQLLEYEPGSLQPGAGLAKAWSISKDAKTYTFHLRQAQFSNGMPVTSADVKYSLQYAAKSPIYGNLYGFIGRIETPNASTVIVKLTHPSRAFMYYVAYIAASIVPSKLVKREGVKAYNKHPIGSGPFILKRWVTGQEVDLVRNPHYWRAGLPHLSAVNLLAIPDATTRVLNVDSGTVDVADSPSFPEIGTIDHSGTAKVLVAPGADMYVVWINNSKPPFNETAVRQALAYATPVKAIISTVFSGLAPQMNTIIPKGKYWTSAPKPYPYDIAKAKQLLAKSSVPHGFSATIMFVNKDQLATSETAQILQSAWAKIGVKLTIQPVDEATQGTEWEGGKYELTLFTPGSFTADVPVDDEFAQLVLNGPSAHNLFTWSHCPTAQRYAKEATLSTSETMRFRLFKEMHIAAMQCVPVIPMVYTPNRAGVRNNVHDFNYMYGGLWPLDLVWLS